MIPRKTRLGAALLLTAAMAASSTAGAEEWRTISSLIGESKYGTEFAHYDYVNVDAPKGGMLNSAALGTFDSFNPFIVRGTPAAGFVPFGGGLLYDTLMAQSTDEPGTSHALLAEAFSYPDDYSSATYRLDANARWHDGQPVTAEDVIWSFNTLKKLNPLYNQYYANVTEAVTLSEREVTFRFDQTGNRELPHIMGDLTVLPKHWWEGTGASGEQRDITAPTLEPPLGSGPYRVKDFKPGSQIIWERVPDYWGARLPVKLGRENFNTLRYTYFRDGNAVWEAFKKGGIEDIRVERRSQYWAIGYDFPAFEAGKVKKKAFPTTSSQPMQGFALNMRHERFQDSRVREALTHAFDFEQLNRTVLYGQRTRTDSYFEGGELQASGLPTGQELDILEPHRDTLPPELFTREFQLPVYDTPQARRANLRRAIELFKQAGWENRDGKLVNVETGEHFKFEYLGSSPTDELIAGQFMENLRRIGIDAQLRIVDPNQEINRLRAFDFDSTTVVLAQSLSPGNEQREFWGSEARDKPGSRNLSGIADPVVDALIDRVILATDRADLIAATHALDRVLLWNHYYIPQFHSPEDWVAWWDKFGMPETQPSYRGVDTDSWWIDSQKAAALEEGNNQ